MKFIASLLLTALLAFAAGLFLSWWSIALVAFLVAVAIPQKPGSSFLSAFAGIFLLWAGLAWWIDQENQQILSHRIAELLPLNGSTTILILVTASIGGLVGGLAGLSGGFLRGRKS